MTDEQLPVESGVTNIMAIPPDASVDRLCSLLVECEKMQHRYQWASGFLLLTLMDNPDAPKSPSEFAEWLTPKTGMVMTQNEIKRRVTVYRFYSPFADAQIIEQIEKGGIRIAYLARKAIDPKAPEQARTVLQACIDNPTDLDETIKRFTVRPPRSDHADRDVTWKGQTIKIRRSVLNEMRGKIAEEAQEFRKRDWVPVSVVLELLDTLDVRITPRVQEAEMALIKT